MRRRLMLAAVPFLVSGALAVGPARAANPSYSPQHVVQHATKAIKMLEVDKALASAVWRAKGVFIVPRAGRFVPESVGAEGIALARHGATWTGPAFYDLSGAGFGKTAVNDPHGAVVLLLMTPKAVDAFEVGEKAKVRLGAGSGLDVVPAPAKGPLKGAKPDMVLWESAPQQGLIARLDRTAITPDQIVDEAYYNNLEKVKDILAGKAPRPFDEALWNVLSG